MNVAIKAALAATTVGLLLASASGQAAVVPYLLGANAPAHCQAFTPGTTNTIRNRVVGSENIGASMAVACAFESLLSDTSSNLTGVAMYFHNNTSADITINCTMLTGYQGEAGAVAVNKSLVLKPGYPTQQNPFETGITFQGADLPTPGADLGNVLAGVNCTLPTGAVINDTYVAWQDENGV